MIMLILGISIFFGFWLILHINWFLSLCCAIFIPLILLFLETIGKILFILGITIFFVFHRTFHINWFLSLCCAILIPIILKALYKILSHIITLTSHKISTMVFIKPNIGRMKSKANIKGLIIVLNYKNKNIQWEAKEALLSFSKSNEFGKSIRKSNYLTLMNAASILGKFKEDDVIPLLIYFYAYSYNQKVKSSALNALLYINSLERTLKELKNQWGKHDYRHDLIRIEDRPEVAKVLAKMKHPNALDIFISYLKDLDLNKIALDALLIKLKKEKDPFNYLLIALQKCDMCRVKDIVPLLAKNGDKRAIEPIKEAYKKLKRATKRDEFLYDEDDICIKTLQKLDPDWVKEEGVEVLGTLCDSCSKPIKKRSDVFARIYRSQPDVFDYIVCGKCYKEVSNSCVARSICNEKAIDYLRKDNRLIV